MALRASAPPARSLKPRSQGLTKLLHDNAPGAVREVKFESYFGRKVAIDASMHIYAFMARSPTRSTRRAPHPACRRWWGAKGRSS